MPCQFANTLCTVFSREWLWHSMSRKPHWQLEEHKVGTDGPLSCSKWAINIYVRHICGAIDMHVCTHRQLHVLSMHTWKRGGWWLYTKLRALKVQYETERFDAASMRHTHTCFLLNVAYLNNNAEFCVRACVVEAEKAVSSCAKWNPSSAYGGCHFWLFSLGGRPAIYTIYTPYTSFMYSMYIYHCVHILQAARNVKNPPANNYDQAWRAVLPSQPKHRLVYPKNCYFSLP